MKPKTIATKTVLSTIFCGVTLFLTGCSNWNKNNIRNILPNEIIVSNTLTVKWAGSFDESQGFGLYEISEATSKEISRQGLSFFTEIQSGKTSKWRYTGDWILHESAVDFSWIKSNRTRRMFDENRWTDKKTYKIYSNKTNHSGGIVVIPEINLVNVYYES